MNYDRRNWVIASVSDRKVYNLEYVIQQVIYQLTTNGKVDIEINEGGDLDGMGLYKILDNICEQYSIDPACVTFHARNIIEKHPKYNVIVDYTPGFVGMSRDIMLGQQFPEKDFNNIKHFGVFIGRSAWERLMTASYLYKNYRDKTVITYRYDAMDPEHRPNLGLEDLIKKIGTREAMELTATLLKDTPIIDPIIPPDIANEYLNVEGYFSLLPIYKDFYMDIVCESFNYGEVFYPTEKIYRCIMTRTPFMLQGSVNFLKYLRNMGFRTFGDYWEESSDLDGGVVALRTIARNIDRIAGMSTSELQSMYIAQKEILDHNYNRLLEVDMHAEFLKLLPHGSIEGAHGRPS